MGGQPVRWLFTPFDARADFILYPCRSPHGGRLKNPRTWAHAQGPSACAHLGLYGSAQGVRKWEGWRSRRSATRATAAPRPERTNKAFVFAAWKGGVRCSDAVQAMAAWLARCRPVPVQRAARSSQGQAMASHCVNDWGRTRQVDVIAVLRSVGDTVSRVACGDI